MTIVVQARNVNKAVYLGLWQLISRGVEEESRNGKVLVIPEPLVTEYTHPVERVLFSPKRDANPFFHLMEALWMLAGSNDLAFPKHFNSRFGEYSDDGKTVWGAYGYRWRIYFLYDQLYVLIKELKKNPKTRRAVLQMWDGSLDLILSTKGGKDVPCNTNVYFDIRDGLLNMTVCCRSNDAIWGAYGANVVHFSVLQEYMAFAVGVGVGVYRQFSNNFHAYLDIYDRDKLREIAFEGLSEDYYSLDSPARVKPYTLISTSLVEWEADLFNFLDNPDYRTFKDPFFNEVALPMWQAWRERKAGTSTGLQYASAIRADDWRIACVEWINRREAKKNAKSTT